MVNYSDIIDNYLFNFTSTKYLQVNNTGCESMIEEMNAIKECFKNTGNLEKVLTMCVCNRNGHQYCICNDAVKAAVDRLLDPQGVYGRFYPDAITLGTPVYADFEELYHAVKASIGDIGGIGDLSVYDTAKRIGHILPTPIYPKQYVYLSAGAKEGASKVLGYEPKFREPIDKFSSMFGTLPSIFIEDILCVFKDKFKAPAPICGCPHYNTDEGGCPFCQLKMTEDNLEDNDNV